MFKLYKSLLLLVTAVWLQGCNGPLFGGLGTDEIRAQGKLIVLIRNAPTVYSFDRDGHPEGVDYDLIQAFARSHDLEVQYEVKETVQEIFDALAAGEGHMAAAGLTNVPSRRDRFLVSDPYHFVDQQVVCRRGGTLPREVSALTDVSLSVISDSSYVFKLNELKEDLPNLKWTEEVELTTETLLEKVWRREVDCTLADSNIVAVNRRFLPELITAFNLIEHEPQFFYFPRGVRMLRFELNDWLEEFQESGELEQLLDKYYGHADEFDYVDTQKFLKRVRKRLPKYEKDFKQAGKKYDIPWTLLASQSYQESHWNRRAKSPTGVRGMMMLTLTTAKEMGVKYRMNAKQSIYGGAKYLAQLRDRLPEEVEEPDRTWFALAAYNVGMGHLYDARELAVRLEKNPNSWAEMKEVLPLLAQRKYHKKLKYGYARGHEPVIYVNRIRNYEDILIKQTETVALREGQLKL